MSGNSLKLITSRTNSNVKLAIQLREKTSARRENNSIFLEGARLCADSALSGLSMQKLFVTNQALEKYSEYLKVALHCAEEVFMIEQHVADALSGTKTTQGIFGLAKRPDEVLPVWRHGGRYLALENIRDPGNAGTLLRTAEAFGIDAVVLSGCGDVYSPKALRAGMGAQLRLPIHHTECLQSLLIQATEHKFLSFAAVPDSDAKPINTAFEGMDAGVFVVIGNEASGLTPETIAVCLQRVTIPMKGRAESLNAAAAGAIICWELCRQPTQRALGNKALSD